MILIKLFLIFFKLGFFSFGGGYVLIPLVEQELSWFGIDMAPSVIADITAIAGLSPGPVGVNAAIAFGYEAAGFWGTVAAFLGIAVPSLIIVYAVSVFFHKIYDSKIYQSGMTGLKPLNVGIVLYAGISMAMKNGMFFSKNMVSGGHSLMAGSWNFHMESLFIIAVALYLLMRKKLHPLLLIIGGAVIGIIFYSA